MRFFLIAIGFSNLLLVARDLLVAYIWGTSLPLDQVQSSQIIPIVVMTICSFVMSGAFLPVYMRLKPKGKAALQQFSFRILSSSQLVFLIVFATSAVINTGHHAVGMAMFGLMFALGTIPRMILIAEGHDRPVLVAPVLSLVVGLALLAGTHSILGIQALVLTYILIPLVEYVLLLQSVKKHVFALSPFSLKFYGKETKMLQGELGYLTAASLFMAVSITVEQNIALSFGAGSLPLYNYATKICAMLVAVGGVAAKNYLFPRISEACAAGDWRLAMHRTRSYILRYLIFITPLCLLLSFGSTTLTRVLFERGAFHAGDTAVVGHIQSILFFQIPSFFATTIAVQALLAARQAKFVMYSWLAHASMRAGGSYLLSGVFGLAGISVGVSFSQLVTAILTYKFAMRVFTRAEKEQIAPDTVQNAS